MCSAIISPRSPIDMSTPTPPSPDAAKLPPSGGGRLLFLSSETYEILRSLVSTGILEPDPKDFEVTSTAGKRYFRPRPSRGIPGGAGGGNFNMRFLSVGVYSNEEGETNVLANPSAPFVVRFVNGLATFGWPDGTASEIIASGIDPAALTLDVVAQLVGATGESGPGITYPEEPEE
jgi:hypothetical protein